MRSHKSEFWVSLVILSILGLSALNYLSRGPSVTEVKSWLVELPPGSSKEQVIAVFSKRKILYGDGTERSLYDGTGRTCIEGNIYCEGDRAISIIVFLRPDGRVKETFVSEGWRGL